MEPLPHLDADPVRLLGGNDPFSGILRAIAEVRVDDAAAARSRGRWLLRQAEEDGTFAGVLVDLAERREPVVITTTAGRRHTGTVRALGADFVALGAAGSLVLVALCAVAAVRTRPGAATVTGDRPVRVERRLWEVLGELAPDHPGVVVGVGSVEIRGELRAVGRDVATLRVDGRPPGTAYVPLPAASEVRVR